MKRKPKIDIYVKLEIDSETNSLRKTNPTSVYMHK